MFNWLKNKTRPAPSAALTGTPHKGEPIIAALLLNSVEFDVAAARQAIAAGAIGGVPPTKVSVDKGFLNFYLENEMVFVAPMGAPYPWSDLEGPCHTSWMWPKGKSAIDMQHHKSHVLVTAVSGSRDAVTRRVLLTHLVGRLALLPQVIGIYWPEATLVHYPPVFAEMSKTASAESPPLYLWVDYRIVRNDRDVFDCFTTGLAPLGLMEMEISGLTMQSGALREWAISISAYMLERGSAIPNGDTIGASATEQLRVTHGPSRFGARGTVMRFGK